MTETKEAIILEDGLVLRFAQPEDIERIALFNRILHPDPGEPERIAEMLEVWTKDLGNGKHPTTDAGCFTLVEDPAAGNKLVSTMCVIPQTWLYGTIPYGMGRMELVGTDDAYRNRGLVRKQFDLLHAWCAEHDLAVQGITGIPYFYRQFGYEMTLNLGGGRFGNEASLPLQHEGEEEYIFRPAAAADIPLLMRLEELAAKRVVTTQYRDAAQWQYELEGRSPMNMFYRKFIIILDKTGQGIGFLIQPPDLWGTAAGLNRLEILPGIPWMAVLPAVIRYLWKFGSDFAAQEGGEAACKSIRFAFGGSHPCYRLVEHWLPEYSPPYAWYMRVADLPAFIQKIAPVLEARLAASVHAGYSGDFKINFYKGGLLMRFEGGKISSAAPWQASREDGGQARFPGTTFYHLLFGHRSIDEINHLYHDAGVDRSLKDFAETLFPKKIGEDIWALA